ncbi:MAG: polyphosphate kinase 1 [Flavobacteriales bacterium]|nr:MAG: polyphosphate kinase 1 [Flavobacteriales bacterium]
MKNKVYLTSDIYIPRDISWLHFNARVLQEANDPRVPLIERIRFLGIFSNNLDEFFKVRYATIKRMSQLNQGGGRELGDVKPKELLNRLTDIVREQQEEAQKIYDALVDELHENGISIIDEKKLTPKQRDFARAFFIEKVSPSVFTLLLSEDRPFPHLRDKSIYLSIKLKRRDGSEPKLALIEIPSDLVGRFIEIPSRGKRTVMYLDDLIRHNLRYIFFTHRYDTVTAHTIKFTRDAELDIESDVSKSFLEKMEESLQSRHSGDPVRFVYDSAIPDDVIAMLLRRLDLDNFDSIIAGGRYHNKKDLIDFPSAGHPELTYEALTPLPHPDLNLEVSLLDVVAQKDILIFLPYHTFSNIIRLLREAALDERVEEVKVTLYRVANESRVISALINAAKNGKRVTVVMELQARFDEENNIRWTEKLKQEGVNVIFGVGGLKVHSKLILIRRREEGKIRNYVSVGTGNFNEKTSRIYTDYHLFTADKRITKEIFRLFTFFEANYKVFKNKHLLLSPFNFRSGMLKAIDREIEIAKAGRYASITLKLNSLCDTGIIQRLYEASAAGVQIRVIVRGICSLIPGIPGLSDNIHIISIVDRFLEHSRVYTFHNDGHQKVYLSSADIMARNIEYRVEVTVPVYCEHIKRQLNDHLEILWSDNQKSRFINVAGSNTYRRNEQPPIRAQYALYEYVKEESNRRKP